MQKYPRLLVPLIICFCLIGILHATDLKSLEKQAKMEFYGKILLMNHYYVSNKLKFNDSGELIGQSEEGTWPTNGLIHIDDVEVKPNLIRLYGTRTILTLRTQDGKLGLQPIQLTKHMQLEVAAVGTISSIDDVRQTVAHVLHEDNYGRKMNEYWHGLAKVTSIDPKTGQMDIEGSVNGIYGYLEPDRPVYFPGSSVQGPKVIHKEET
jgi:hypothetical protein